MAVENVWNNGITGNGIKVAVIDDGVDLTHDDLQSNLLPGFDATGNNSGGAPTPNNSHGTSCAGIIASLNNNIGTIGIAFNSNIIPIRMGIVTNDIFGNGVMNTNDTWTSDCINEAVSRGADIISNSWTGGSPSAQVDAAIQNAVLNGRNGKGCVLLFSAGNNNSNVTYPATNGNVIAVGASTPCDTRKRSSNNPNQVNQGVSTDPQGTSCDGESLWGSNFGNNLDLIAPGVLIPTTDNFGTNGAVNGDYNTRFNGTSAACPNAAGVVALILSANPNLTGQQARNILESNCDKVGGYIYQSNIVGQPNGTWNNEAGYGRVNATRAVCSVLSQIFNILGNDIICNNSVYSISNLPNVASVNWTIPSSAGPVLQLAQNSPTTNMLTITNQKWYGVSTTLTATISGIGCPSNFPVVKSIVNDNSTTASIPYSYYQESCLFYNVSHPSQSGTIYSNSSPVFVHQGCMVYVPLGDMAGRTVNLQQGSGIPLYWGITGPTSYFPYSNQTLIFQLPYLSGGIPFTFEITGNGACFTRTLLFFSYSGNARYGFAASPNPAKENLTVVASEDEKYLKENKLTSKKDELEFTMNVYDATTSTLQITQRSGKGSMQHNLNVSKLKKGYYVLQIVYEKETQSIKFFKD